MSYKPMSMARMSTGLFCIVVKFQAFRLSLNIFKLYLQIVGNFALHIPRYRYSYRYIQTTSFKLVICRYS